MILVLADGDEVRVDGRGEIGEMACRVADLDDIGTACGSNARREIAQVPRGELPLAGDPPPGKERADAVEEHDVRFGCEGLRGPGGGLDARVGEIDADDDAQELHGGPPRMLESALPTAACLW